MAKKLLAAPGSTALHTAWEDHVAPVSETERTVTIISDLADQLAKLDRYASRSLSRRRNAVYDLDLLG